MIAYLRGSLLEKHPNQAIVDAGGVGYDVTIPISTYAALPEPGQEVRLRIHTHVREDALLLFGFLTADEKMLFERLISVSGIGPKLGITVLSGLPVRDLVAAIRAGEVERLVRIPGVGKKTAERIILELREKLPAPAEAATFGPGQSRLHAGGGRIRRAEGQAAGRAQRVRAAVPALAGAGGAVGARMG